MSDLIVTYGETTFDFNTLPQATMKAMLRRGVSHFLGSEQASKVTAFFDPDKDVPVEDTPDARKAKKAEFVAAAIAAMIEGTVGTSTRGPSVDPLTAAMRTIARTQVQATLAKNKIKWPKKADDTITTPDGGKYTAAQLIDRRLANPKFTDDIRREAEKVLAEKAKKAKKLAEKAETESADDL